MLFNGIPSESKIPKFSRHVPLEGRLLESIIATELFRRMFCMNFKIIVVLV